jgi:hypothetical protein
MSQILRFQNFIFLRSINIKTKDKQMQVYKEARNLLDTYDGLQVEGFYLTIHKSESHISYM